MFMKDYLAKKAILGSNPNRADSDFVHLRDDQMNGTKTWLERTWRPKVIGKKKFKNKLADGPIGEWLNFQNMLPKNDSDGIQIISQCMSADKKNQLSENINYQRIW